LQAITGIKSDGDVGITNDQDWETIVGVLDQHYNSWKAEAAAICEKHISNRNEQEDMTIGLIVDEFDSETIMQHCAKNSISYLTVFPALK
jgi:hypothetical protein